MSRQFPTCDGLASSERGRRLDIGSGPIAALKALYLRHATARRLNFLGDRELADIGLRRSDIPKIARLGPTRLPLTCEDHQADHAQPNGISARG